MPRVAEGDLVIMLKHRSCKRVVYQVVSTRDKTLAPGVYDQRIHLVEHETGRDIGWCYCWDVEVVKSIAQQKLERLRVQVGLIAQHLELHTRIPGNKRNDLIARAEKTDQGWVKLAEIILDRLRVWLPKG